MSNVKVQSSKETLRPNIKTNRDAAYSCEAVFHGWFRQAEAVAACKRFTEESIIKQVDILKISPRPSLPKSGISSLLQREGRKDLYSGVCMVME